MTPEQWGRLKELFELAAEMPPQNREEFLGQKCGGDAELRTELARLLAEHDRDSGPLSGYARRTATLSGAESPPRFAPGKILARRFRIVHFLARGGMGEVYEAEDMELGEHVALKAIRPEIAGSERVLGAFKREIQLARKVTHPNVCRIYDLVQDEQAGVSTMLLSMELIEGQTLAHHLKERGPLTPQAALPIVQQMASALRAAHDAGVIHRDFKHGNVMLADDAGQLRAVVMDFGLAFADAPDEAGDQTGSAAFQGTPNYMAPEQLDGGPVTTATDIYALGLVVKEVVGRDGIPAVWEPVINQCLERDPARRYGTPTEVVEALRAALHKPRRLRWVLGGAAVLAGIAAVLAQPWRAHTRIAFQQGNWVLLAAFENRTGESTFDGALKTGLERELDNSGFVSVAGEERVSDALRMMKKPPGTRLDRSLAREVSLRDGAIAILVTGRTEKSSRGYSLTVQLVDPVNDRTLAADTEQAAKQQLQPAIQRLSNWMRESLGEEMSHLEVSKAQLEKVTTPSLLALEAFSNADAAAKRAEWQKVLLFARQALAEDPSFASAHNWLAWALRNLGRPEWTYEAQRARELESTATERERLFIEGSYLLMTGQKQQAVPVLSELVRLYPDHYFAYVNLANALSSLGDHRKAGDTLARIADLRPNDYATNARAASELWPIDLSRGAQYARRAILLAPHDGTPASFYDATYVFALPFFDVWETDAKSARAELDTLAGSFANSPDLMADWRIGELYLALGQIHTAREWFARTLPPDARVAADVYALYVAGDEAGARARLEDLHAENPISDVWFVVPRLRPDADKFLAPVVGRIGQQPNGPKHMPGEIALSQGRLTEAITLLQTTFDKFPDLRSTQMVAESLAKALDLSGNKEKAVTVLEEAGKRTKIMTPVFWIRNQAHLSAYYHSLGREIEANSIDEDLRRRLAVPDADYPLLKQLQR